MAKSATRIAARTGLDFGLALLVPALGLAVTASAGAAEPVRVDAGLIAGVEHDGVSVYKGIPYAAPPTGALRWQPPGPAPNWQGVRAATAFGPTCPQPAMFGPPSNAPQSEDCLSLNIWRPAPAPKAKLPVMVWIHGGAYVAGSGSDAIFDGAKFARKGVVLVTINYRLGILGFFAHPALTAEAPDHVSGNYGLLDQIAALHWVHDNIAAFGGDPDNVTIFGESAGGGSVMLLTVSPMAKGLFRKAIIESGAALPAQPKGYQPPDAIVTLAQAERAGAAFAEKAGAPTLAVLRAMTPEALIKAQPPQGLTWPIADGRTVPGDVTALYRAGRQADVPVLLGWNSAEGVMFARPQSKAAFEKGINDGYGPLAHRVQTLYPVPDDTGELTAAQAMFGDVGFGWPNWSLAEAQIKTGKAPVYVYHFDQPPPRAPGYLLTGKGAFHADELAFVFGNHPADWPVGDKAVSALMQDYWVNFARTGNPNGRGAPAWPPYAQGRRVLWFQNGTAKPGPVPREEELKQLDQLVGG